MQGSAGPAEVDEARIVVYQSTDREGSTFALSPDTRRILQARFGSQFHALPRIFVAHAMHGDVERLHGRLAKPLVALLTGLDADLLEQVGDIEFRDPVTECRL